MLSESGGPRSARFDVSSTVVRLALCFVAHENHWQTCDHALRSCGCTRVSDRLPKHPGAADVYVVRDNPAACQEAIGAVLDGRIRAVVLWCAPDGLRAACDGLDHGMTVIPHQVIELAALAPQLTPRHRETLRLLAHGRSSIAIAQALHQSESTSKRDIAELLSVFDAPNRAALISAAQSLGFVSSVAPAPSPSDLAPDELPATNTV